MNIHTPMLSFNTPLSKISSIKKLSLTKLEHLGLFTVRDLFYHFPHRYEDYSAISPIDSLIPENKCTVIGTVTKIEAGRTFKKKMFLTEATVEDETGTLRMI
ncbi:MAG: DNA helicase RecG, partial [Patescibacteria group bacterium]